jgi:asparagine synthase (glutamine-hydrolysing)
MCGIAGYVGVRPLGDDRVSECLRLMGRRGPDAAAAQAWVRSDGAHIQLLHSRLSIIDLGDRANQPFHAGSKWLVFNGELYNYLEVREDLLRRGRRFTTSSDTEVLLEAIDEYGDAALDRCEGMWAFAVYDDGNGTLLLSRDRFGEKPLYVYRDTTGFYFGSEVKFIVALRGARLVVNLDHLYRYLVNGYKALYKNEHTFFKGLQELMPGTTLTLDDRGGERTTRYWHPTFETDPDMSCEEAVAGARERLIRAVELRLRADVPLAFCMSGGVDSNALIGIARNVFGYDVHGFTIVNSDARYEEQELVEYSARTLGIRHTSIPVQTTDFLPRLRTLVRQHDGPVYTITYYAQWLLQGSIADHGYRIAISGTAADEIFSGYYDHFLAHLYEVRHDVPVHAAALGAWQQHVQPMVRNPYLRDPDLFVKQPGLRDHIFLNADGFAKYLRTPWHEPFAERAYSADLLRNRMLNEMFHEAVPVNLHEDDLNAMYFSIENRSPFLDRGLFEFCQRIPTALLIRDGRAKAILRDAVRGLAPERVIDNRRKVGFNAPIYAFLDVHDPLVRSCLLAEGPVFEHVRRDKIETLLAKPDLPNSESKFLFNFLCTKMFLEEFA